jgi:hypothetical protein
MGLCFYLIYLVEKFENLFQQPVDLVADKSHFFICFKEEVSTENTRLKI